MATDDGGAPPVDIWRQWDAHLTAPAGEPADEHAPEAARMYSASVCTMVVVSIVLCVVCPSWVRQRPSSSLRATTTIVSRVLIVAIAAGAITIAVPMAVTKWKGRSA